MTNTAWDKPVDEMPVSARKAFRAWALDLMQNEPRTVQTNSDHDDPTDIIFVDAKRGKRTAGDEKSDMPVNRPI